MNKIFCSASTSRKGISFNINFTQTHSRAEIARIVELVKAQLASFSKKHYIVKVIPLVNPDEICFKELIIQIRIKDKSSMFIFQSIVDFLLYDVQFVIAKEEENKEK